MIILDWQIRPLGTTLKKNLPQIWLWPRVGKFIVKFHRINVSDAMARSTLALETPNECDTLDIGWGAEARMVLNNYVKRNSLSSDTMLEFGIALIPCKNFP